MKTKVGLIALSLLFLFGCGGESSGPVVYIPERVCRGPCDVIFVGDSMTDYGPFGEIGSGVAIYCNCGISGIETAGIVERLDRFIGCEAGRTFLMIGVNDINHEQCLPDRTFPNYQTIVMALEDAGMEVIIQLTLHTSGEYNSSNQHIRKLNDFIVDWCNETGRFFIDPNEVLSDNGELIAEYTYDGLHCNTLGYEVWVNWLRDLGLIPPSE